MNDVCIVIPSYKRADHLLNAQGTLSFISEKWKRKTILCVRDEELEAYERVAAKHRVSVHSFIPEKQPYGWGNTMDHIFDTFLPNYERVVTMDDDLSFDYRSDLSSGKALRMTFDQFDGMMEALISVNEEAPLAGILARGFFIAHKEEVKNNYRLMQVFSVYSKAFVGRDDLRFSKKGPFYISDVFFTLNTLQKGIRNKVYCRFLRGDTPNTPGGCAAIGRNPKEHELSIRFLKQRFPQLIRVTTKSTKNWEGYSMSFVVDWKNAYKEIRRK